MTSWHVHVILNRCEERLQPFIRGSIRKIAGIDLGGKRRKVSDVVPRQRCWCAYFEAGDFFNLRSRRHAVFGDRGGGGVRHWGNELVNFGG